MKELLLRAGLGQTESAVLSLLIEIGSARGSSLSQRLGIKRPTVYSALASLERRGLVLSKKREGATLFQPSPSHRIPALLRERAEMQFHDITLATGMLEMELKKVTTEPVMLSGGLQVTTLKGVAQVYAWLVDNFSAHGYDSIFNPQIAFAGPIKQAAKDFMLKISSRPLPIREIAVRGPLSRWWKKQIKNASHQVKEIELPEHLSTDINLCNGTVCMVNYERHSEMAVLIKHPQYFASMKAFFEVLWTKL